MDSADRYAFIDELCRIPESDEERLRRGRFVGEPEPDDDEDEDEVESTGIVMVSLPETPEEGGVDEASAVSREAEGEVFLTPREENSLANSRNSSPVAEVEGREEETEKAVDLGRDTDLGSYSEAELAGDGVEPVPVEIRVSRIGDLGDPSNSGKISQSLSKPLKNLDAVVDSGVARNSLRADRATEKRKSIDDIDKFRYVGGEKEGGITGRARRALPGSISGQNEGADGKDVVEEEGGRGRCREGGNSGIARKEEAKEEITLLDVLKFLAGKQGCDDDDDEDDDLEGLSVWDAAKRKGMTFP